MKIIWGTKKWQIVSAIVIAVIFGYGTYALVMDIIVGNPMWWYNASFILFAFALLGLLLLVREGRTALHNIATYGVHPALKESYVDEEKDSLCGNIDDVVEDYENQVGDID
jgi:hypothetical protein